METSENFARLERFTFDSLSGHDGLINHFRSLGAIKEVILPSSKYRGDLCFVNVTIKAQVLIWKCIQNAYLLLEY